MPMSKAASARVARRIATAAAYGSGGLGLLGGAAVGLLFTEVQLAKRKVGGTVGEPPPSDGRYGAAFTERSTPLQPLQLAFLGDSTAAGLGVHHARHTPGGRLASALAAVAERPVELQNVALSGAQSDDLERQVTMVLGAREAGGAPDVCVVIIGANDVTHRMPPARSVRHLSDAVARLRTAGCEVIVGTCPDLGTIEPVGQPLRWIARRLSRQLAAAQTIAVVEEGGRTVSLSDLLGPEFAANPDELFGPDNYHPSTEGYATAAMAVLPTLCAALGLWPTEDEHPVASRREGILPVARAAAEAAAEGGTEVAGVRGPWALLKHRRRRRLPPPEDVGVEHTRAPEAAEPPARGGTPASRRTPGESRATGTPERTEELGDANSRSGGTG
nr:SGNH/GDSL hydrolase family protein [Streptomyces sulphureus]